MHVQRTYRDQMNQAHLVSFRTAVQETDLLIQAEHDLSEVSRDMVLRYRGHIESYIARYREFASTLAPWPETGPVPAVIREMVSAGRAAGVGPMAAVAGAVAQQVGHGLCQHSREVVVENGGDLFIKLEKPATIGIFAGDSPLSMQLGVKIDSRKRSVAVCTSSGTVGHSLSLGVADAVTVIADSCSLADAAATAIGNRVTSPEAVQPAIEFGRRIEGVKGLLVICNETLGAWRAVDLVRLGGKKG